MMLLMRFFVVVIVTVLWNIKLLQLIMFYSERVTTEIKRMSLIYSFESLFRCQCIRNVSLIKIQNLK